MANERSRSARNGPTSTNGNGHAHVSPDDSFPLCLLVDDNARELAAMDETLRQHGFRVITAKTYDEAKRQIESVKFAAVIADYRLGPGYDGFDLLKHARETQPLAIRVIVTSDEIGAVLAESVGGHWISKREDHSEELPLTVRAALKRLTSPT